MAPLDTRDFETLDRWLRQTVGHIASLRREQKHAAAERSRHGALKLLRTVRAMAAEHGYLADVVAPVTWDALIEAA